MIQENTGCICKEMDSYFFSTSLQRGGTSTLWHIEMMSLQDSISTSNMNSGLNSSMVILPSPSISCLWNASIMN